MTDQEILVATLLALIGAASMYHLARWYEGSSEPVILDDEDDGPPVDREDA